MCNFAWNSKNNNLNKNYFFVILQTITIKITLIYKICYLKRLKKEIAMNKKKSAKLNKSVCDQLNSKNPINAGN